VSQQGELIVAPASYSTAKATSLIAADTAYNVVDQRANSRIVITSIILYANKDVGVNDATVEIYEATAPDTTTVSKSIFKTEMLKQTNLAVSGLNLVTNPGVFLNIKTNDASVFSVIGAYYVKGLIDSELLITE
jgi:hypothetical protein